MAIKYFYIDDDNLSTTKETAKGLSVFSDDLEIEAYQHKKWPEQVDFLIDHQNDFDGLLLDWSLTQKNESGEEADFDIEALAQQLRRLVIHKKKFDKDFPIVLCSANYQFRQVFSKEATSHDLFDAVYEKEEFNENREVVVKELIELAKGYKFLNKNLKSTAPLSSSLNILREEEKSMIDDRLIILLRQIIGDNKPPHEVSRFILEQVIKPNGLLINQHLLAARLGIDILNASNMKKFTDFKNKISKTRYKGIFSNAWERWWMKKILVWWKENFDEPLGKIVGSERVKLLNNKFQMNLIPAKPTELSRSEMFWTICSETNKPLAIEDAIIAKTKVGTVDWLDDEYYSIDTALQKDYKEVNLLEKDRLKKLKNMYAKTREKNESK